jgi:hypothetical protein
MQRQTLESLYRSACSSYSRVPNPDQCLAWESVLNRFRLHEIGQALMEWQADVTEEYDGRPRGKTFPSPADLAVIVVRNKRINAAQRQFTPCNSCDAGWIRVFQGTTIAGKQLDAKVGALRRCECWWEYLAGYYGVPRSELAAKLTELKRDREKRKRAA